MVKIFLIYSVIACLISIGTGNVKAQSLNADLLRCYQNFTSSANLHLKMEISYFTSSNAKKPVEKKLAEVKVRDGEYLTTMEHLTMLVGRNKALMINRESKTIFWQSLGKEQIKKLMEKRDYTGMQVRLDSMLMVAGEVSRTLGQDSSVIYGFSLSGHEIASVELSIDLRSGMFKRITYVYNEKVAGRSARVEVDYHYVNLSPVFSDSEFDTDNYFIKEGKTFKTTPAYERYNLYEIDFHDL